MRIDLDVSALPPCEPLELTLEGLRRLRTGDWLRVSHRREPFPLYQLLEQAGFRWETRGLGTDRYEIRIWRAGDTAAERAAREAI